MKLVFINLIILVFLFAPSIGNTQAVKDGLIAYYPFNGNARDSSTFGNNAIFNDAVLTDGTCGKANSAYLFNGLSTFIEIPSSESLESPAITNQITQAAWIYLNGSSLINVPFYPVMSKSNSSINQFMYSMGVLTSNYNNWNTGFNSTYNFELHRWYFIAATYNGAVAKNYINGRIFDSAVLNTNINRDTRPLNIGRDTPGATEIFNGKIDDIYIYNRALNDNEILALYNSGCTTLPLKLTKFEARQNAQMVEITWHTENEVNTDKFVIERALNNNIFKSIGTIKSNNTGKNTYAYNDNTQNLDNGILNYRLQQVDKDGTITYSNVMKVKLNNIIKAAIFPNPVKSTATIQLQSKFTENILVKVVDSEGKIISSKSQNLITGNNIIPINTINLPFGIYTVILAGQSINEYLKLLKQE